MKKHLFFILALLAFSGILSFYLVKYHFFTEPVKELPAFTTYKKAVSEILPSKLYEKAGSHKCGDFIIPLCEIEGDNKNFEYLADDINLAIQTYSGWKLSVDKKTRKKMIKRADERFKTWGAMGVSREMIETAELQKRVAMKTRYSAKAKCFLMKNKETENVKVLLTINDEKIQAKLFDIPIVFTSESSINEIKNKRDKSIKNLKDLKRKSELSVYGLYGSAGVFLAYILFLSGAGIFKSGRLKRKREWLLNEIEKREELINEGHYVTALELADDYLKCFPKDTDIKAFKQRLLDYTGNDPKKAQAAFVEWKKLQMRMNKSVDSVGIYLSEEEKKNILPLTEHHPELKTSYLQLEHLDNQKKEETRIKLEDDFKTVLKCLKTGKIKKGKAFLNEIIKADSSFEKAFILDKKLKKSSLKSFRLASSDINKEIIVFIKDKVAFGRGDENFMPDVIINDRRVSRDQMEIEVYSDKVTAKDNNSTAGTFLNGEKIDFIELNNYDLLNISKVYDFDVFIMKNSLVSSIYLRGKDNNILIIRDYASFDISEKGIRFSGEDLEIKVKDDLTVLSSGENIIIPQINDEIIIRGNSFKVEEI